MGSAHVRDLRTFEYVDHISGPDVLPRFHYFRTCNVSKRLGQFLVSSSKPLCLYHFGTVEFIFVDVGMCSNDGSGLEHTLDRIWLGTGARWGPSVTQHRRLLNIVGYSTPSVTQHRR
jgi:hypothetical protein